MGQNLRYHFLGDYYPELVYFTGLLPVNAGYLQQVFPLNIIRIWIVM